MQTIALDQIDRPATVFPRAEVSASRVRQFKDLYSAAIEAGEPDPLPPVITVCSGSRHILADGWHRFEALQQLRTENVSADVREAPEGTEPIDYAYDLALAAAVESARPLTASERKAAVARLLASHPARSWRVASGMRWRSDQCPPCWWPPNWDQ